MPVGAAGPSTQLAAPELQRTTPCTQGALGLPEQVAPSSQVMHVPALVHTWPVPHEDPAGRCRVELAHEEAAPQTVSPSTHWSLLVEQGVPGVHVTQSPPRQTRLLPQLTPAAEAGPSMQDDIPFWQKVTPVRQGAPVFPVHGWLSWQPAAPPALAPPAFPPPVAAPPPAVLVPPPVARPPAAPPPTTEQLTLHSPSQHCCPSPQASPSPHLNVLTFEGSTHTQPEAAISATERSKRFMGRLQKTNMRSVSHVLPALACVLVVGATPAHTSVRGNDGALEVPPHPAEPRDDQHHRHRAHRHAHLSGRRQRHQH